MVKGSSSADGHHRLRTSFSSKPSRETLSIRRVACPRPREIGKRWVGSNGGSPRTLGRWVCDYVAKRSLAKRRGTIKKARVERRSPRSRKNPFETTIAQGGNSCVN